MTPPVLLWTERTQWTASDLEVCRSARWWGPEGAEKYSHATLAAAIAAAIDDAHPTPVRKMDPLRFVGACPYELSDAVLDRVFLWFRDDIAEMIDSDEEVGGDPDGDRLELSTGPEVMGLWRRWLRRALGSHEPFWTRPVVLVVVDPVAWCEAHMESWLLEEGGAR